MEPSPQIFTLLLLMFLPMHSNGYPDGMVQPACTTMVPQHGVGAQTTSPPYSLSCSSVKYAGILGFTVTIIKAPNETDFKGFMIQARAPNGNTPQGKFVVSGANGLAQTLNCNAAEDTVSHTSPILKSNVTVIWLPPEKASTGIQFRATVVKVRDEFWTNLLSDVIPRASGGGPQLLAPAISHLLFCSTLLIYALFTI